MLELSLRESLQLGHDRVGTGHLLLGLIREGDGVAAQVLVRLGADLNQVREQVIELVSDLRPQSGFAGRLGRSYRWCGCRLAWNSRRGLAAVEQRVGMGPEVTSDLDEQIAQVRREEESAVDALATMSRPRSGVTGRRNCWPPRPRGRSSGPPGTRRGRI